METDDRRQLYSGFGDSLVWAVEFVATPVLFGFLGHLADAHLGTTPWLTIGLVVFALAGLFVRTYYGYEAAMREHEARAPWASPPGGTPTATGPLGPPPPLGPQR